ncbi:thermonuclease family protein [Hyphomicrobium sp.]|uniref:thermonuclease family protein n=1 Tax=Hyphomicrobium sp. TaxID=82 RepID=UPI000FBD3F9A|nr:thermonuclease family protein [Hyphomicrobium sp.]RUP11059.1 MAG: thermonuclease family protein [Hyphomicrobium sp.]
MQPNPPKRRTAVSARRINGHLARWGPYVRLALTLIVAATAIFAGRDHWRLPQGQYDPFPPRVTGLARSIDGDSLWVDGNEVRLQGIDAPEGRQTCLRGGEVWKCGEDAYLALVRAIGGETVTCDVTQRDVYGRLLARCTAGGRDLNAGMVAIGMAVAYGAYDAEEAAARSARRGLWAGEFDRPDKWRAENKTK